MGNPNWSYLVSGGLNDQRSYVEYMSALVIVTEYKVYGGKRHPQCMRNTNRENGGNNMMGLCRIHVVDQIITIRIRIRAT